MADYVVTNIDNVIDSSNEAITIHSVNRNFEKLLQNDINLAKLALSSNASGSGIQGYIEGVPYGKDDLVWFKDEENNESRLYVLKSLIDNNTNKPTKSLYNKIYTFEPSGWRDMYEYGSMVDNDLSSYILRIFNINLETFHNLVEKYHKFGSLTTSADYDDTKLLRSDFSNIESDRESNFYPYQTVILSSNNVILNGQYRKWDNGLLEYDIVFRLGYSGDSKTINGTEYSVISANNLSLENSNFYLDSDSSNIFNQKSDGTIQINDTYQVGLNKFCNTYSGRIVFEQPFISANYMIFSGDIVSQERNVATPTIDTGANSMTYTNKSTDHIDPVYIVYPNGENVSRFGLVSNSFHCHIVGRWK